MEPKISDYHADLRVPQQASVRDIKRVFFKLAKEHHPDKRPRESLLTLKISERWFSKAILNEHFELITYSSA